MAVSYESKRCNIVLFGISGSGKSTLANKILRHDCFSVDLRTTSVTNAVSSGERVIEGPNKVMYSVKVVNTMGFSNDRRDPDDTVKAIQKFFREQVVEGISLVLFVMKRGRVTIEMAEMVELIKNHFKEISAKSALVITHCEPLNDKARECVVEEYKTSRDPKVSAMHNFMKKGIYTVGFPDLSYTKEGLREVFQQGMEADVQAIHEVIYKSTEMILTSEMFGETIWKLGKQSSVGFRPTVSTPNATPQPETESKTSCIIL